MTQVYIYSVLIDNFEIANIENLVDDVKIVFKDLAKRWIFQHERGEKKGKDHLQCFINLKEKKRKKPLMKLLNQLIMDGTCRATPCSIAGKHALKGYCMKATTRISGPWADRNIYMGQDLPTELYPWQTRIVNDLDKPVTRKINWYYDDSGGRGKSTLSKWLYFHKGIITLTFGNAGDLLNLVSKFPGKPGYIFDLSRTKGGKSSMAEIYQSMESIANGYFINTKYECDVVCFNSPHVIVFSNHLPDKSKLSADRWNIIDMAKWDTKQPDTQSEPNEPGLFIVGDHTGSLPPPFFEDQTEGTTAKRLKKKNLCKNILLKK